MPWRPLAALLLGAVVAVATATAVMGLGSDGNRRPPDSVQLAPGGSGAVELEPAPTDGEPAVVVPPPVHLPTTTAPPPTTAAPAPPPTAAPSPPPLPAPVPDDDDFDDDDFDDDDFDDDDDDEDDD